MQACGAIVKKPLKVAITKHWDNKVLKLAWAGLWEEEQHINALKPSRGRPVRPPSPDDSEPGAHNDEDYEGRFPRQSHLWQQ